ncbi:MAG: Isoquinoline 1-oxidoreductase alpha subunit, partial [uncultured Acetobacteraceae bacterium]
GDIGGERHRTPLRGRPGDAAALVSARRVGPHRHQVRLRPGAVRRLHCPRGRFGRAGLPNAALGRGGRQGHDHRGPVAGRRAPGPGRVARAQRVAVRLLPNGADHAGGGVPQGHAEPDGRRHRLGDDRQPVPLRHLPPHPRRHQAGRREGRQDM